VDDREHLTLAQAAERLGVHYMTAYRYVRTGRLPAERAPEGWRVAVSDVDALAAGPRRAPGPARVAPADLVESAVDRLIHGDRPGAVALVDRMLLSSTDPTSVYLELLAPAMALIGTRWAAGELSVAQEHRATVAAYEVLGQLAPRFARRGRRKGVVVIGAVPGDPHGLPSALLREALRVRGYEVVDLGASAPPEGFVDAVDLFGPVLAVGVCSTLSGTEAELRGVVDAVRSRHPGTVVFAGGGAVADHAHAEALGLPVFTASPYAVLQLVDDLALASRWAPRPHIDPEANAVDWDGVVPPPR
jgi:excisionase family DNA binding protein